MNSKEWHYNRTPKEFRHYLISSFSLFNFHFYLFFSPLSLSLFFLLFLFLILSTIFKRNLHQRECTYRARYIGTVRHDSLPYISRNKSTSITYARKLWPRARYAAKLKKIKRRSSLLIRRRRRRDPPYHHHRRSPRHSNGTSNFPGFFKSLFGRIHQVHPAVSPFTSFENFVWHLKIIFESRCRFFEMDQM